MEVTWTIERRYGVVDVVGAMEIGVVVGWVCAVALSKLGATV